MTSFTLTVTEVNDPPITADDEFTTAEEQPITLTAAQLLSNDSAGPDNESDQAQPGA